MTATRSMVRPGAFFFTLAGDWTFEVEQVIGDFVLYKVVETNQRCKAKVEDFIERVRPAEKP